MNPLSRPIFLLLIAAALCAGCSKKKAQETAAQPTPPAPAASSRATPPPADAPSADVASDGTSSTATSQPVDGTAPAPVRGVAPALAAADAAYEAWFKKHRLDLSDPNMLDADADGDGASNRDEFMADTDPRDPLSRPPVAPAASAAPADGSATVSQTMRLKEYNEVAVPYMLESVDGETARIRRTGAGGGSKVETVRAGQTLPESNFKVERVLSRRGTDKMGVPTDSSRVTLEDPSTKERVALVKNMAARSASSYAVLTSPNGKTTLTVRQGDTFNWPGDEGVTYKVVDLRADQVVLQQMETGSMVTVPKK